MGLQGGGAVWAGGLVHIEGHGCVSGNDGEGRRTCSTTKPPRLWATKIKGRFSYRNGQSLHGDVCFSW